MAKKREVEREIAQVLVTPVWQEIGWISLLEVYRVRDRDVTPELLAEHFACSEMTREEWARLEFLREALTPAHREQLVEALDAAPRHGLVELLAWTCETARDLEAALRRAGAGKALQPAIDFALRRFAGEPAVAKKLWTRAKPFAKTAARGKWKTAGQEAWRALYVTDTRESAEAMKETIAATFQFTNLGVKERICDAAAKRARFLTHASRCAGPLVTAVEESYTREEITHSAVAIAGKQAKAALVAKWAQYTTYQLDNNPARTALGGLLRLAPVAKAYRDAATKMLPVMLKETDSVALTDIGRVNGIVMGIEAGRVTALRPLLEKVAKWRATGSPYDDHGEERNNLAVALVRRRARRALDAGWSVR